MTRHAPEDDWNDEESSWDDDDEEDFDEDDRDTIPCPYCRREVHEDAERCPYCENYISDEDRAPSHKPWWVIVGAVLCLYAMLRWLVG